MEEIEDRLLLGVAHIQREKRLCHLRPRFCSVDLIDIRPYPPVIVEVGGGGGEVADLCRVDVTSGDAGLTFALGLGAALWSASAYVGAFIPAANVVWEVDEARPLLEKLLVRLALTVVMLVLVAMTALSVVLTGPIAQTVGGIVGLGEQAVTLWAYLKWPFLAAVMIVLLAILYWASPNIRHPGWRWVVPGSVVAVVLWIAASLGFTLYVTFFGSFNATYGSIGGVVVFLIWLWLTNIAILLGAELNAEIERTRAIEAGMRPADKTPFLPSRDATR